MVEADTQKPITNLKFRLTYKGNTKIHQTDGSGVATGITAEVGQDIEVSMAGERGLLQPIFHFKVVANLDGMSYTVPVKVHAFEILVKDHRGRPVPNTDFMLFYRGRQIKKRSNKNGVFNTKMLVGFVYGFGLIDDSKPLIYLRCMQGNTRRTININDIAYHRSQTKGVTGAYIPSQTQPSRPPSAPKQQQTAPRPAGQSTPPRIQQNNTHTEKQGNPLTVVTNKSLASDTTRYHIYHNGTIKRENKDATGYAEFIYYDKDGGVHDLGKSRFIVAPKRTKGNVIIAGKVYLVDARQHSEYRKGNIGYKWSFILTHLQRYYLNGITMSAVLGTLMTYNNEEFVGSGFSNAKGESVGSSSHRNGEAGDFRYLSTDRAHRNTKGGGILTSARNFDMQANTRLVNLFKKFGFRTFYTGTGANSGVAKIPGTSYFKGHHDHLHIGNHNYEVTDI